MKRILAVLVSLAALSLALPAHADSIFSFENTADSSGSNVLAGTITISTASSQYNVTGGSFTYGGDTFSTLGATGYNAAGNFFFGDFTDGTATSNTYFVYIVFPPNGVTGDYTLCTLTVTTCGPYSSSSYFDTYADVQTYGTGGQTFANDVSLTAGDLTPQVSVAATPEPSSLILLGTGILGAAALARRKLVKA